MSASIGIQVNVERAIVIETTRLRLSRLELRDAPFILELLNEPGWLRFIGDKDVHCIEDAERYLRTGPLDSYARLGFGLFLVERKADGTPLGMCGLIKRDMLEEVDIGFALLERESGRGFAHESAVAVLNHAKHLGLTRLMAITTPENEKSQRLLRKLGMRFEREIQPGTEPLHLFVTELT